MVWLISVHLHSLMSETKRENVRLYRVTLQVNGVEEIF